MRKSANSNFMDSRALQFWTWSVNIYAFFVLYTFQGRVWPEFWMILEAKL